MKRARRRTLLPALLLLPLCKSSTNVRPTGQSHASYSKGLDIDEHVRPFRGTVWSAWASLCSQKPSFGLARLHVGGCWYQHNKVVLNYSFCYLIFSLNDHPHQLMYVLICRSSYMRSLRSENPFSIQSKSLSLRVSFCQVQDISNLQCLNSISTHIFMGPGCFISAPKL